MLVNLDQKTKVFINNDKLTEKKRYIRAEVLKLFRIDCLARSNTEKERLRFLLLYYSVLTEQYKLLCEIDIALLRETRFDINSWRAYARIKSSII